VKEMVRERRGAVAAGTTAPRALVIAVITRGVVGLILADIC
jgi:hypothetical protein